MGQEKRSKKQRQERGKDRQRQAETEAETSDRQRDTELEAGPDSGWGDMESQRHRDNTTHDARQTGELTGAPKQRQHDRQPATRCLDSARRQWRADARMVTIVGSLGAAFDTRARQGPPTAASPSSLAMPRSPLGALSLVLPLAAAAAVPALSRMSCLCPSACLALSGKGRSASSLNRSPAHPRRPQRRRPAPAVRTRSLSPHPPARAKPAAKPPPRPSPRNRAWRRPSRRWCL